MPLKIPPTHPRGFLPLDTIEQNFFLREKNYPRVRKFMELYQSI